jgi:DNA-binding beta-propeller fold protein YncE
MKLYTSLFSRWNWVRTAEILIIGYVALVFLLEIRLLAGIGASTDLPSQQPAVQMIWGVGAAGSNLGEIQSPLGLAVDAAGNSYAADRGNHRVQKFLPDGQADSIWSGDSEGQHPFIEPSGIAVNLKDQSVWILDSGNGWIYRLDSDGRVDAKIDGVNLGFYSPRGLAISETGDIFVADTGSARILHLNPEGKIISQWGNFGSGAGQFKDPMGIVATEEMVIVADSGNSRIQLFDLDGKFSKEWKVKNNCSWLAYDGDGHIYVSDTQQQNIYVFGREGGLMAKLSSQKTVPWLDTPTGIAAMRGGKIFVIGASQLVQFTVDWSKSSP